MSWTSIVYPVRLKALPTVLNVLGDIIYKQEFVWNAVIIVLLAEIKAIVIFVKMAIIWLKRKNNILDTV